MERPDPRLNAYRGDLADARLRGIVEAPRYTEGRPARVVAGRVPVRRLPSDSETVTHYHYGEAVMLFDEAGGWAWCQSQLDRYVGYVATRHVAVGDMPASAQFVATLGAYAYETPDLRSPAADFLPRHAAVVIAERGLLTRGTEYARLDTGGFVPLGCLSPQPPQSPDIVAAAALYLGAPYLWGGRSLLGIDCSGLVQAAFRDIGVGVWRDTDQQCETIGRPATLATPGELVRGDLLYLPGHVMLYAGDGGVIHADGATMTVRHDNLGELMRARRLDFAAFAVRRP